MPVSAIGASLIASSQSVASGGAPAANTVNAAVQEATESPAQTAKEAKAGDPVARRKLARIQAKQLQQQQQQQAAPPTKVIDPNKGSVVDHDA